MILYHNILYYFILLCYTTILYYIILYYIILYYIILYYVISYIILYYNILNYTILYYTILYCTIRYYTILYNIIKNSIIFHYIISNHIILWLCKCTYVYNCIYTYIYPCTTITLPWSCSSTLKLFMIPFSSFLGPPGPLLPSAHVLNQGVLGSVGSRQLLLGSGHSWWAKWNQIRPFSVCTNWHLLVCTNLHHFTGLQAAYHIIGYHPTACRSYLNPHLQVPWFHQTWEIQQRKKTTIVKL